MSIDRRGILKLLGAAATTIHKPALALAEATKASAVAVTPAAAIAQKAARTFFHVPKDAPKAYRKAMQYLEAEMHGWHKEETDVSGGTYIVPPDLLPFKSMSMAAKLTEDRRRRREESEKRKIAQIAHEMLKKQLIPKDHPQDEDEFE